MGRRLGCRGAQREVDMRVWCAAFFAVAACSNPSTGGSGPSGDAATLFDTAVTATDADAKADSADIHFDFEATAFTCTDGDHACFNDTIGKFCVNGEWQAAEKCPDGQLCKDGFCAVPTDCKPNEIKGCAGGAIQTVCSSDGKAWLDKKCPGKQQCAAGKCQDVVCTPKFPECTGTNSYHVCKDDGSGFGESGDCKTGALCVGGKCVSLCETNLKIANNVGCEYWSVDLDNDSSNNPAAPNQPTPEFFPHSVVIANPGVATATVKFTVQVGCASGTNCQPGQLTCDGKPKTMCTAPVAPYQLSFPDVLVPFGQSKEFKMPVMNFAGSGIAPKAIHIQSDQPVVAFQFNPFNSENATSNDGSLLLPQNTLGKEYYGVALASRPAMMGFAADNGYVTAVATVPGTTTIEVTPTTTVLANPAAGVPQDGSKPATLAAGKTYTFALQQYDVLNLESQGSMTLGGGKQDLIGTHLKADKVIAVFSGHQATGITDDLKKGDENWDTCCTEHLEEQMMPLQAWGKQAYCVKAKPRGYDVDHWVVVAGTDNVTLSSNPPIKGIDGVTLAKAGDSVHIQTPESFMLTATGQIEVVQFLVGSGQTQDKTGDPSMMLVPPAKQYRDEYVIQTADGYSTNWLTVVRPKGVKVQVDSVAVPEKSYEALGDGTWEFAYYKVGKGSHTVKGDQAFGLMVYGYGGVTAYGYPGGMNLAF